MSTHPNPRSSIPISMVAHILEGAAREGVSAQELFVEAGLEPVLLDQPTARISGADFARLLQIVMRRTEDEFIGFGRGAKSKPGTFSMMAHAVINSPNLEKAILRSTQFYQLFDFPLMFTMQRGDEETHLEFTTPAVEFRDIIAEALVVVSLRFWCWLTGRNLTPNRVLLDFPAPPYAEEIRRFFRGRAEYGAAKGAIVIPTAWLSLPLVQNPLSLSKFLKDSLAQIIVGNMRPIGLPEQIRAIISKEYGNNFPEFSVICEKLNMTPQTLRRRLKDSNTSYQEIKDSIRQDAAIFYLAKEELSIDEIALMMGFSEASSFHRAFKKWTGQTPANYRRELLGLDVDAEDFLDDEL